jgi:hypothetical protein
MTMELQPRDRLALVLLASALAVYVFFTELGFPFYDELAAAEESALEKEDQLRRYRRAVVRKADYGQLLEDAKLRVAEGEARLIRGDNPSLASAELQTIVEGAAEKIGIELGQRSMSPASRKDDFFNEITMTLVFECTPGQLVGFLSELRNQEKFMTVLTFQATPLEGADQIPVDRELTKDLRVDLTLGTVLSSAPVPGEEG